MTREFPSFDDEAIIRCSPESGLETDCIRCGGTMPNDCFFYDDPDDGGKFLCSTCLRELADLIDAATAKAQS